MLGHLLVELWIAVSRTVFDVVSLHSAPVADIVGRELVGSKESLFLESILKMCWRLHFGSENCFQTTLLILWKVDKVSITCLRCQSLLLWNKSPCCLYSVNFSFFFFCVFVSKLKPFEAESFFDPSLAYLQVECVSLLLKNFLE